MAFVENLKQLPGIAHLKSIRLIDLNGGEAGIIENRQGQSGSLAVYNHLAQLYGAISAEAARKGLELYAEHAADATKNPGKHPNIDRLAEIADGRLGTLRVRHEFATDLE